MNLHRFHLRASTLFFFPSCLLLGAAPFAVQTGRIVRGVAPPGTAGASAQFGRNVINLGDVNADGRNDFAVGAPFSLTGGNGAGEVRAISGRANALLWSVTGSGGWVPCSGGGTTGDILGYSLALVPDMNGDGIDDVAIGAPWTGIQSGSCRIFGAGQLRVVSGTTGATLFSVNGTVADQFVGLDIQRIQDIDFDGVDDVLARESGNVLVRQGGTMLAFTAIPLNGETVMSGVGDFDQDGLPWEIALGDPFNDMVRVVDVFLASSYPFSGAGGESFGAALAPLDGSPSLLVGAPAANGGAGAVDQITLAGGVVRLNQGTAGSGLGNSISSGGDVDGDGSLDYLVGASAGNGLRILDKLGATISSVTGSTTGSFGASAAFLGDFNSDGFHEFIVTDPTAIGGGHADIFWGGPSATLNPNLGPGCATGAPVPLLTLSAPFRPGTSFSMSVSNTVPFSVGHLVFGFEDPLGTRIGNCRVFLALGPFTPQTIAIYTTNAAGNWTSAPVAIPPGPPFLGAPFALQSAVFQSGATGFTLSNAVASKLGW